MNEQQHLTGIVVSGVKKGAFFTQLDWVQEQCLKKLGFKPWPGTLNLKISDKSMPVLELFMRSQSIELVPPDPNFCSGHVYPVNLSGITGGLVLPAEDVRVHETNVIEIIAPVYLKDALHIKDGDEITVSGTGGDRTTEESP